MNYMFPEVLWWLVAACGAVLTHHLSLCVCLREQERESCNLAQCLGMQQVTSAIKENVLFKENIRLLLSSPEVWRKCKREF